MRFVKEVFKQMARDLNNLIGGYGAITLYSAATLAIMILTAVLLFGIDFPSTTAGRATGVTMFLGTLLLELILSCWIWDAATKAKKKIDAENEELMRTLKADPETYQ